jgi:S-layer protein
MTGLTTFNATSAGDGTKNLGIKAAATTDVAVTVSAGTTTVNGGKTVSITGGGAATVNDAAGTNTGTTLTAVTLTKVDADSTVKGGAITTLTVGGATGGARTYTVDNATASHNLTVNANGTGYKADGSAAQTKVTDTVATTATVNTTAKSSLDLSGSTAVKTVTLTGSGALTLKPMTATTTTIAGSAATGNLTLGVLDAAAVNVSTGSGNDTFTTNATAKTTIDTGAGNDIVTLGAIVAAGSTISLGAGNDTLLGTALPATSASATSVIDGGDGVDSVSSSLINAGNASLFKNFENVSLQGSSLDLSLMTASTITGLSIDAAATTTVSNAKVAQSLTVNAAGTSSTINFADATGTADTYSITFNASSTGTAASPTAINAGTVVVNGIETVAIHSNAAAGVNTNSITLTDDKLQTVTIDGSQAATVAFTGTNGTVVSGVGGVSLIDGSAATGQLNINEANITAATAGITIKGGSAADTITTSTFASTLTGNGGADNFVVGAAVVANADVTNAAFVSTSITDFAKGDTISFKSASGTTDFATTKIDVSSATNLQGALDTAAGKNVSANDAHFVWFQYGGFTYVVEDLSSATALAATDVVVKLTGTLDLSTGAASNSEVFSWA